MYKTYRNENERLLSQVTIEWILRATEQEIFNAALADPRWQVVGTTDDYYLYLDRGANLLGVAHLDTVLHNEKCKIKRKRITRCPQLDDRLGAWILLDLLSKYPYDILLTTNEENGASTAIDFVPPEGKEYNWAFQFDRAGKTSATYCYDESDEWISALKQCGIKSSHGSYTDIRDLKNTNCCAINFGCGYRQNHTQHCHASWSETLLGVQEFLALYRHYKLQHFPFVWAERNDWKNVYYRNYTPVTTNRLSVNDDVICDCGRTIYGWWNYCPHCGVSVISLRQSSIGCVESCCQCGTRESDYLMHRLGESSWLCDDCASFHSRSDD